MKPLRVLLAIALVMNMVLGVFPVDRVGAVPSTSLVIGQLQTGGGGSGTATEELVLLSNVGAEDINVTDWCIEYSSATNGDDFSKATCIVAETDGIELWIGSGGQISFATDSFVSANSGFTPDFVMSGGYAAGGGHVRVVNGLGGEVDRLGWGSAVLPEGMPAALHVSGEVLSRDSGAEIQDTDDNSADFSSQPLTATIQSGLFEQEVQIDLCLNIEGVQIELPVGYFVDTGDTCVRDACFNIDGLQLELPEGMVFDESGYACIEEPVDEKESATLHITELYPNAPSYDTGQEFIELFNPNAEIISLEGYALYLGPAYQKEYVFASGELSPGAYTTVSDIETGIVLPNGVGSVRLIAPNGDIVDETGVYTNPREDESWAVIDDTWAYTNQVTPGAGNEAFYEAPEVEEIESTVELSPCADGYYRNPETNRCKAITDASSDLVPCGSHQYRSPETNRCRNLPTEQSAVGGEDSVVRSDGFVPCREDQFRNPATNRCRNITTAQSGLAPCAEGQERNPATNRCRGIVLDDQVVSSLVPCRSDQERNPLTNRCRLIQSAVSDLVPCGVNQYRSPETNRCRNIATTAVSSLVPCREGQFRNPETNRCKSITTASTELVPCNEGQERNPETNRCRKVQDVLGVSASGALPAVTDVAVKTTNGNINWLPIAGVFVGVGGYLAYEWRAELVRKLRSMRRSRGL